MIRQIANDGGTPNLAQDYGLKFGPNDGQNFAGATQARSSPESARRNLAQKNIKIPMAKSCAESQKFPVWP